MYKNKGYQFSTDELKRILFVANTARFYVIKRYKEASGYLIQNEAFIRDLMFKFNSASYLLHKLSPEKFDEYGCTLGSNLEEKRIAKLLYSSDVFNGCGEG